MLSTPVGQADTEAFQQRSSRQMTVLINAAVRQGERDGLCRIRNMSETGLMIETALPLPDGCAVTILLRSGKSIDCVARWSSEGRTGLSCAADPTEILLEERKAGEADAGEPIQPRFVRPIELELVSQGFVHPCSLHSISAKDVILTEVPTEPDLALITVCIPHLGDFPATVRVREDGNVFARFTTPLGFAEFNRWLVRPFRAPDPISSPETL